jgi:hypothetical protein
VVRTRRYAIGALLIALAVSAVARAATKQYVLPHPSREHCRAHYIKKAETVKKRARNKTTTVRETFCVYVAPKLEASPVTPAPTVPAPVTTPTPAPSPAPTPSPTPTPVSGEDHVGSTSHAGDAKFCEEHRCIGNFTGEDGTVVECVDGTFSHAGGISGACSDHGGESIKQ